MKIENAFLKQSRYAPIGSLTCLRGGRALGEVLQSMGICTFWVAHGLTPSLAQGDYCKRIRRHGAPSDRQGQDCA